MAGSTKAGAAGGVKARVFAGWAPRVGVICRAEIDGEHRPFLPMDIAEEEVGGWLFPIPDADDASSELRVRGFSPAQRRAPCYCKFARTRLSQV